MESFSFKQYSQEFRDANISRKYFEAQAKKFLQKDIITALHKEMRDSIAENRYPSMIKISAHHALWPREQKAIISAILKDTNVVDGIRVDEITFRETEHSFVIEFVVADLLND